MSNDIRKDITGVVNQYLCHSCGSCFSSCRHDSISFNQTTSGYLFPLIDYNTCTNCGLCYDVCPGDHFSDILKDSTPEDPFIGNIISTYVGKSTDENIFKNSQSGGAVTAFLKYLLDFKLVSKAIVTTMGDEYTPNSLAVAVNSSDELMNAQKSKYTPTNIVSLLLGLENIEGKIALVGLSCHMHGVENLLKINKKLRNKVIKIGLICERVMLHSSVEYFSKKTTNLEVKKFLFKDPTNTKYPGDTTVLSEDGKLHILDRKYRKKMKDFFTPARCMLCFDKMNIYSDVVVGDPHGLAGIDREDGESLVITRTELGEKIVMESISSNIVNLRDAPVDIAIKGQGINKKRKKWHAYYKAWSTMEYDMPDYPKNVLECVEDVSKEDIDKAKKNLEHALYIDKVDSKDEIFKLADKFYENKIKKQSFLKKIGNVFNLKK